MKQQHGEMEMEDRWGKSQHRPERQQSSYTNIAPWDTVIFTITFPIVTRRMDQTFTIRATTSACFGWEFLINSRNRRTKQKEVIRFVNLKHLFFPTSLAHLSYNTATYHQAREYPRSNSIPDPIIHHPGPPCSDTHTAEIAGIEMDTRSESTSMAHPVCCDCNYEWVEKCLSVECLLYSSCYCWKAVRALVFHTSMRYEQYHERWENKTDGQILEDQ